MTNKILFIPLFILIFILPLTAQNYLWPTDASTYMSSSFCEFREGHYHSAIDIKTWLQEGYKCFAIADGKIERIRVSPFGYGKVLYLRLNDGNIAVYAHLQRFNAEIDRLVREKQLSNQKYRLNWYPKNLFVKKGQVVAYTGRTGIGVPHLHFEIRNRDGNPINPLKYYTQIKDRIRPRLKQIGVVPRDIESTVNGANTPQVFDLSYIRDGIYVIKEPIYVRGNAGLILNGFDQADEVGNKYGFHQTTLSVDGSEIFNLTYDELKFSTTAHIYSEIYYPFWADKHTVFNKLYIESFNPLEFYTRYPGENGTIHVSGQPKAFTITVSDFHGNQSIIKGELIPDTRPEITVLQFTKQDSLIYLRFKSDPLTDLKFYSGFDPDNLAAINYFEINEGKFLEPEKGLSIIAGLNSLTDNYFKVEIRGTNRMESKRIFSFSGDSLVLPDMYFLGDRILYQFRNYPVNSCFSTDTSAKLAKIFPLPDGSAQIVIPKSLLDTQQPQLEIYDGSSLIWRDNPQLASWNAEESRSISWFDSAFTITPGSRSFLYDVIVKADTSASDSLQKIIPVSSPVFSLKPNNIPVFQSASVCIRPDSIPAWGTWAIFKTNDNNSLAYVGGIVDSINGTITANSNPFGNFIVACDTIQPDIHIAQPVQGKSYKTNPPIQFSVTDLYSGIGSEENITILIDGEFVLPEWDPEDELVMAKIDTSLISGNHILTISVKDQCGNITRKAVYFTIK